MERLAPLVQMEQPDIRGRLGGQEHWDSPVTLDSKDIPDHPDCRAVVVRQAARDLLGLKASLAHKVSRAILVQQAVRDNREPRETRDKWDRLDKWVLKALEFRELPDLRVELDYKDLLDRSGQ